jgi:ATP-dependent Clp protease ATP-binding subunit ClpC
VKSTIEDAIKRLFNPEFINRIDDFIIFKKLEKKHIYQIIDIQTKLLRERIKSQNMTLEFSDRAKDFLVEKGFDEKFGARPLRRAIQKYVEDEIADSILKGIGTNNTRIYGDYDPEKKKIVFSFKDSKPAISPDSLPEISIDKLGLDTPDISLKSDEVKENAELGN